MPDPSLKQVAAKLPDEASVRQLLDSGAVDFKGWWALRRVGERVSDEFIYYQRFSIVPGKSVEAELVAGIKSIPDRISEEWQRTDWADGKPRRMAWRGGGVDVVLEAGADNGWRVAVTKAGQTGEWKEITLELARARADKEAGEKVSFQTSPPDEVPGTKGSGPWKVEPITSQRDGTEVQAWKVTSGNMSFHLASSDGVLLLVERPKMKLERITDETVAAFRRRSAQTAMELAGAETRDFALRRLPLAAPVTEAKISLKKPAFVIPSEEGQKVEVSGDVVTVQLNRSWFSTLTTFGSLEEFARVDASLNEHEAFKEIVSECRSAGAQNDAARLLANAAVRLNEVVGHMDSNGSVDVATALKTGSAGAITWTRLLVEICRHTGTPARELHGFLITPDPPSAERRVWVEILEEGHWLAFDPWLRPAPSDDGYFDLEILLDMECEGYVPAPVMSLHLAVVRGVPDNSAEQFLNAPPAVLSCDATEASAVESDR